MTSPISARPASWKWGNISLFMRSGQTKPSAIEINGVHSFDEAATVEHLAENIRYGPFEDRMSQLTRM